MQYENNLRKKCGFTEKTITNKIWFSKAFSQKVLLEKGGSSYIRGQYGFNLMHAPHARTHARTHACTHTHTRAHAQTHTHVHARTHARTHAPHPHTHTHTHTPHTHRHRHSHTHSHTHTHTHYVHHVSAVCVPVLWVSVGMIGYYTCDCHIGSHLRALVRVPVQRLNTHKQISRV